jgi:cell division protein FtsQ
VIGRRRRPGRGRRGRRPEARPAAPSRSGRSPEEWLALARHLRGADAVDRTTQAPSRGRGERRRERALRRHQERLRHATPWLALAAFAAGMLGAAQVVARAAAWRPGEFAVRDAEVAGAVRLAPAEVLAASGLSPGDGWLDADPASLAARLAAHPWIARAEVTRLPPATVLIRIEERRPAATLQAGNGPLRWVDPDGVPFGSVADSDAETALPRLVTTREVADERPDAALADAIALARALGEAGLPAREIAVDGGDPNARPAVQLRDAAPLVVLGSGDRAAKLGRLARVLAEVPESRQAAAIDLRFADQAILRPARESQAESIQPERSPEGPARKRGGAEAPQSRGGKASG